MLQIKTRADGALQTVHHFRGTRLQIKEGDPERIVTYWLDEDGRLIARYDSLGFDPGTFDPMHPLSQDGEA